MQLYPTSANKIFYVVLLVTVAVIYVLITWMNEKRVADFVQHQNSIALKVASSTALEISTYIQNRRDLLSVLNKSYYRELIELNNAPNDHVIRENIREQLTIVFPEIIDFTIATKQGNVILPTISNFVVGGTCRQNIVAYSKDHLESIFIHSNPEPKNYHFDVLTTLDLLKKPLVKPNSYQLKQSVPNDEISILFMSLGTSVIENILDKRPPEGHQFFLIKGQSPYLIEISALGNKGELNRQLFLSEEEIQLIDAKIKVIGTSWTLFSTFNYSAINEFKNQLSSQKYILMAFSFLIALIVSVLLYRMDKKRLLVELSIKDQNVLLEEKVAMRTQELTYQATHDELTKLINRREFERRLKEALSLVKSDLTESIVMYLDLDQFKVINDTAGHAAGDELLIEICSLLKGQLRRGDTLARLGGDEFGILLTHCDISMAENIAEQLCSSVHQYQFGWEGYSFYLGVSIGIIEMNEGSKSLSELLSLVDAACYMAKEQGRNQYYVYQDDDSLFEEKHSAMYRAEMAITAIKEGRLELHGQKIFNISGSDVHDSWYEVLVRIKNEDGLLYPDMFIPALEKFGYIAVLDKHVLLQSILFLSKNPKFKLSINLSGLSIVKPELIDLIYKTIKTYNIDPNRVCFEITESAAIGNLTKVKSFIKAIHQLGCLIALDDFGTGMSSFSYLSNLDVDYIKLDGSFVKDINTNSLHATMVESINAIVQSMDKYVIAEYVETYEVSEKLKRIGVSLGQGYYRHRPEKLDDLASA